MLKITPKMKNTAFDCVVFSETGNDATKWYSMYLASIGQSGLSFGPIQFDISVSQAGRRLMLECGVPDVIVGLLSQVKVSKNIKCIDDLPEEIQMEIREANFYLQRPESKLKILMYAKDYVERALYRIASLSGVRVPISDLMVLFLIDYHIQFYISTNGAIHNWLKTIDDLNIDNYREYKKTLKWFQDPKGPADMERRFQCVKKFAVRENMWFDRDTSTLESDHSLMPEWLG